MATLAGCHPEFADRVRALLGDPRMQRIGLYLVSGFRPDEEQRVLFEAAVHKYGSTAAASRWVAPPGKSRHGPRFEGFGIAVDLGVPGVTAVGGQWPAATESAVNQAAAGHGLYSPMDWEDWHFEPSPDRPLTSTKEDDMAFTEAQLIEIIHKALDEREDARAKDIKLHDEQIREQIFERLKGIEDRLAQR